MAESPTGGEYEQITQSKSIVALFEDAHKVKSDYNIWTVQNKEGFLSHPYLGVVQGKLFSLKTKGPVTKAEWYQKDVSGSFRVRGPLFLFKSKVREVFEEENQVYIEIPKILYKLQRRQNFRVDLSPGDPFSIEFELGDKLVTEKEVEVVDVSLGGLGIKVPLIHAMEMMPGDVVKPMTLIYDKDRKRLSVSAEVRYKILIEHKDSVNLEKIGLKFEELDSTKVAEFNLFINKLFRDKQILSFG